MPTDPTIPTDLTGPQHELYEQLAGMQHAAWARWMQHLLDDVATTTASGTAVLDAGQVARWRRQIATPYPALSETEKDAGRAQVARFWPLIPAPREHDHDDTAAGAGT